MQIQELKVILTERKKELEKLVDLIRKKESSEEEHTL
jgi:hypothetical protein